MCVCVCVSQKSNKIKIVIWIYPNCIWCIDLVFGWLNECAHQHHLNANLIEVQKQFVLFYFFSAVVHRHRLDPSAKWFASLPSLSLSISLLFSNFYFFVFSFWWSTHSSKYLYTYEMCIMLRTIAKKPAVDVYVYNHIICIFSTNIIQKTKIASIFMLLLYQNVPWHIAAL